MHQDRATDDAHGCRKIRISKCSQNVERELLRFFRVGRQNLQTDSAHDREEGEAKSKEEENVAHMINLACLRRERRRCVVSRQIEQRIEFTLTERSAKLSAKRCPADR